MQIKGLQLALVTCGFLAILPAQRAVAENADGNGFPQFVLDYDPSSVAMTNDHQCEYWPQTCLERWSAVTWRIIGDWRKLDRMDEICELKQKLAEAEKRAQVAEENLRKRSRRLNDLEKACILEEACP